MAGEDDTPDDSIASALASAIAQHEKAAEAPVEAKPQKTAAPPAETGDAPQTETEGQTPEAETGEPKEGVGETGETKTEADKTAASVNEPPKNWKADEKEEFKQLPPKLQETVLRREKEREALLGRRLREIDAFKHEYDPVNKMLEPYREQMKAGGWTPFKLIEAWANAEKGLTQGGESAENVVAGLVRHYQVNMGNVARKLGIQPRARPNGAGNGAAQPGEPEHGQGSLSPDHPLFRQLNDIQRRLDASDRASMDAARRQQTAAETRVMSEIDQFKSATDDGGNLLHPHFDELEATMVSLAQSANASGKPLPLKELYETALWANPSTRAATLAAQERAQQEKAASEARAKAAAARKAGSSVVGAPGTGQAPTGKNRADMTLREQLLAAHADTVGGRI